MKLSKVLLEEWMRLYYFEVEADIGSSGVQNFSMSDLRELLGFTYDDVDRIVLRDSESRGGAGVRQALADRWLGGRSDHVLVTHGSSEALYLIMTSLLSPGDEILVLDPCYPQHYSIADAMGCRIRRWPLRFERGFRPDLREARDLIGPGTRMVVVNFPHNPTGATLTLDEQDELLRLVEAAGAYLVWDGVFSELTYETPSLPEPALRSDRVLSVGTLSKAYGLPGLRVGWCFAAPELLQKLIETRDHVTLHLSPLVEFVAAKAITGGERLVGLRLEQARANRALLAAWVSEHSGLVEWVPPAGGVSAFVRLPSLQDVDAFCHQLAREHGVLLIPGSCFDHPQHARLGFGDSQDALRTGLSRLSQLLRSSTPFARSAGTTPSQAIHAETPVSRFTLVDEEVRSLQGLIAQITAVYESSEDPGFLLDASVLAHEMPRRLRTALNTFRLAEPDCALLIISGYPINDEAIGATPGHWLRSAGTRSPALEYEILFVLTSALLGDCIGWSTQQGGRIIHDVLPIRGMENEQIGVGSEQLIWWHTEDAFHPLSGDYVGMMCLRNLDRVPTTFASLEQIRLDPEDWQALFEPLYTIQPDNSHRQAAAEATAADNGDLETMYHRIEEMRQKPDKVAILSGDPRSPYIRIDPYFMDPPDDPRARKAFAALTWAIDGQLRDLVLESGDICFIDNLKAVHGRRAFKARYDGRDRWLKRLNIARDLRKSRVDRPDTLSRVIR